MASGGKGGTETSSTTTSMPPPWAQGMFEKSAKVGQRLYDDNVGFHPWEGPSVVGFSNQTKDAFKGMMNAPGQLGYKDAIGDAQRVGRRANDPLAGQDQLEAMARGDYLADGNPYYRKQLDQGVTDLTNKLNSQFSGSGRYGSAANMATVGQQAGNMLTQGLSDNYDKERQAQLQANNMLLQRKQAADGTALGAIGAQGSAAQGLMNSWNTKNASALQAGQSIDRRNQAELQAQINAFNAKDNRAWTRLGALQSAASGAAGSYGTQSSAGQQSQQMNMMGPLGLLGSFALK